MVTVNAPSIKTDEITYHILKQFQEPIQKTIMVDTHEDLKAYDAKGTLLTVKIDVNSWSI
jgi:hypothetical protein